MNEGERPAVRVNQVGYLPGGPKRAVWVTDGREPAPFRVLDAQRRIAFRGRTRPWPVCPDPSSGLAVHVLTFTDLAAAGSGFVVEVGDARSRPFTLADALYQDLTRDALTFFHLQRSGFPIDVAGYERPAGHPGDGSIAAWTGPDADRLYPGWSCPGRFDVSGGWYDAGDHGKYVASGSLPVWQLLTTVEAIRRTRPRTPWWTEVETLAVEECRWQLDWLLRMQVPRGSPHAGMAFHRVHGTEWAPLPCWPHEDPTTRVLHRPSTSATLQLAAAAACGARVLRADARYAARLLGVARRAFRAAATQPVLLAPNDEGAFGGGPYDGADLDGDRAWAAAELGLATGEVEFAVPPGAFDLDGFDVDRTGAAAVLDLAVHAPSGDLRTAAAGAVVAAADRLLDLRARQPWGQPYAPVDGWHWGSNGRILANSVVLTAAHELTGERRYADGAVGGLDHLLGVNALGQSYVTGHGTDCSHRQRTRHFARALDPAFPPPPPGALAGGPTSQHHPGFPSDPRLAGLPPQLCYLDEPAGPSSETTNDVCIRWNAPLVRVAAALTP